jgi:hypothetical protein
MSQKQALVGWARRVLKLCKPYLRWTILGGTLFFLLSTLRSHWEDIAAIRIDGRGWACLAIALGMTLLAHIWSGWVWSWILRELQQPALPTWGVLVYLKTNIAKYLPGNVWHFYGRVWASKAAGFSLEASTLSVLLEPLLMAAAALMMAIASGQGLNFPLQLMSLVAVLTIVHPRILNLLLRYVGKLKGNGPAPSSAASQTSSVNTSINTSVNASVKNAPSPGSDSDSDLSSIEPVAAGPKPLQILRYPLGPLLGELLFLGLRGVGFLWVVLAIAHIERSQILILISAFSFAWLLGLVVPGAPGGIGVFEATAVALLDHQFSAGLVLSSVALYRLISTLAEATGAGLAWLDGRWNTQWGNVDVEVDVEPSGNVKS